MNAVPVGPKTLSERLLNNPRVQNAVFAAVFEWPTTTFFATATGVGSAIVSENLLLAAEHALIVFFAANTFLAVRGAMTAPVPESETEQSSFRAPKM